MIYLKGKLWKVGYDMFEGSVGFTTYNDFFKRRNTIKKEYGKMKDKEREIYRMYLYSQRDLSTQKLDLIWEFLNEPETSCYCPTDKQLEQYFSYDLEEIERSRIEGENIEY